MQGIVYDNMVEVIEVERIGGRKGNKEAVVGIDIEEVTMKDDIAIRGSLYINYCIMKGKAPIEDDTTTGGTISGNIATHNGNILTDSHLFTCGHLTNTSTFHELYGIYYTMVERYSSMCPNLTVIIILTEN